MPKEVAFLLVSYLCSHLLGSISLLCLGSKTLNPFCNHIYIRHYDSNQDLNCPDLNVFLC
jgi:hypothetical protein